MTTELKIVEYPHPILREVMPQVTVFDEALKQIIKDMFALLYKEQGVGLAANQVGLSLRLFVMDPSTDQSQPMCFINPVITEKVGVEDYQEGCMSFPGIYIKVKRAKQVTVQYQDENGEFQTFTTTGLAAECIQHESEHLDGITFLDHLSKLKRELALKKLKKYQRYERQAG